MVCLLFVLLSQSFASVLFTRLSGVYWKYVIVEVGYSYPLLDRKTLFTQCSVLPVRSTDLPIFTSDCPKQVFYLKSDSGLLVAGGGGLRLHVHSKGSTFL